VDSDKLRGLLLQLQHLVGPHFGGDVYFDLDHLTHDVIDEFKRDIPMANQKAFILVLNHYASVEDEDNISDTSFRYNLYSYLIGKQPPSTTSRRRREHEEIATEGESTDHHSDDDKPGLPKLTFPSLPLLRDEPRVESKGHTDV
jgi:hypothetical protein